MAYTWTELLDEIKVRGAIPTSQNTFTEARLLALTNSELRTKILPLVDQLREAYYSYDVDTAINASGVYPIHTRAVGAKLLNVALIDGDNRKELTQYTESDVDNYAESPESEGFFLKRSQIYIIPRIATGFSLLRQTILLRPGQVITNSDAAKITNINPISGNITFETVPAGWVSDDLFDMVQAQPHFDTLGIDLEISGISTGAAGVLTFTASDISSRLAIGDWVSLKGETPVIQTPVELQPLLAQYVANVCLKSQGDVNAYNLGIEAVKEMKDDLSKLLSPRVNDLGRKIVNRTGILRRGY